MVNSLARFDPAVPMVSMTMAQFLAAARNGRVPGHDGDPGLAADGETLPIAGRGRGATAPHGASASPQFLAPDPDGDGGGSSRYLTDSDHIVVRFGQLKGVRKVYDTHALYFPLECAPSSRLNAPARQVDICREQCSVLARCVCISETDPCACDRSRPRQQCGRRHLAREISASFRVAGHAPAAGALPRRGCDPR